MALSALAHLHDKADTLVRRQIEEFLGTQIFLGLFVKVRERWREDAALLDEMGMGDKGGRTD